MKKYAYLFPLLCIAGLNSCIDEVTPTDVISNEQVQKMSSVQESMLWGLSAFMVDYNTWNGSDYLNDWGYPCQMYFREICGADFPVAKSTYDYWTYYENSTYTSSYPYYTWNYYYRLVKNANNLIQAIGENPASELSRHYLGGALAFRSLAYLDLARLFEFKPTGFPELDAKAESNGIWGLTVPIVNENTTSDEILENPRVDFCTMYRFIMHDLERAETMLNGYEFEDKSLPGSHAVYGLMARAWMEIGSRYEENLSQLSDYTEKMAASNAQNDGYGQITALTAHECYTLAASCAEKAMEGYSPVTQEQWHSRTEGFNTANQAWIWRMRYGGKEQLPTYYCSFLGQASTEPSSGLGCYGGAYRCISSKLFGKINNYDWRKTTWISSSDAGKRTEAVLEKYQTSLPDSIFAQLPKFTNFKFRPGSGNLKDANVWLISDLPVMRMEEMIFIKAEAVARTQGWSAGLAILKDFVANQRFTSGKETYYKPNVGDLSTFIEELVMQKRIELWGEGICFFDLKRLNMTVDRTTSNNIEENFMIKSRDGYCCPWLNFYILQYETQRNTRCIPNPDVSGFFDTTD